MSKADTLFIDMCRNIIDNGYSTEGEKVRPKWEDGSYAYTIKQFGVVNRYSAEDLYQVGHRRGALDLAEEVEQCARP